MTQDDLKKMAAEAALEYVEPGTIIGIGTGSTANHFIDLLAGIKHKIDGTVASSNASAQRLAAHGIPVLELNTVSEISVYIDGADESTRYLHLIKGGGGALTREKIVAACSRKFVCVADGSKLVDVLGKFPLPIEVIPMARSMVARELVKRGGQPIYRHTRHSYGRPVRETSCRCAVTGYRGWCEKDHLTIKTRPIGHGSTRKNTEIILLRLFSSVCFRGNILKWALFHQDINYSPSTQIRTLASSLVVAR